MITRIGSTLDALELEVIYVAAELPGSPYVSYALLNIL